MITVLLLAGLSAAAHLAPGTEAAEPSSLRFPAGPAELVQPDDPATPGEHHLLSRVDYGVVATVDGGKRFVTLSKIPEALSTRARFGVFLVLEGRDCGFAVDGDRDEGFVLYPDLDCDGDLTDDAPVPLERRDGYYTTLLKKDVAEGYQGKAGTYPVQARFYLVPEPGSTGPEMTYRVDERTVRRGTITVGGRRIAFAIVGNVGLYDQPQTAVWIDLNGDGRGLRGNDPTERFNLLDRRFELDGQRYEFWVDRYGRSITLTPFQGKAPKRASFRWGGRVPPFSVTDDAGRVHRLEDYRGRVLLIDVWAAWCPPCRDETADLTTLYGKYHDRGFDILGLTSSPPKKLREFVKEHGQTWPQVFEPAYGPIHEMLRNKYMPDHILIGRDGRVSVHDVGRLETAKFEKDLKAELKRRAK